MKADNCMLSVIIPLYNAEKYIERCARSLFEQTLLTNIEFIFLNDSSSDKSLLILENIINEYPRVKQQTRVINNPYNLGVSDTRKRGIQEAVGEYIAWIDSDDWVEPNMLESLWKATDEGRIDIIVQNVYVDYYENEKFIRNNEWRLFAIDSPKHALMYYYKEKYVPRGLPFQMCRRSLILDASKRVHNVNYTEDTIMLIYVFANARNCVWLEKAYYHYCIALDSNVSLTRRNYKTKEEWCNQVLNIDDVTKYLMQLDSKNYRLTSSYIKLRWKKEFRSVFKNKWQYWHTYREAYRDVILLDQTDNKSLYYKVKYWLTSNFYPLFWLTETRKEMCK